MSKLIDSYGFEPLFNEDHHDVKQREQMRRRHSRLQIEARFAKWNLPAEQTGNGLQKSLCIDPILPIAGLGWTL